MPIQKWTIEKIRDGFERFKREYGRIPSALEIDSLAYLPSSRLIQKSFGGLVNLRAQLGYENNHFGKGTFRSEIAARVNKRGRSEELALEKILCDKFGEICVHTEKIFNTSTKHRLDFYIYTPEGNFGIDVFYTESLRSLQSNVNIKMNKYRNFPHPLFLVVANKIFKQDELDNYACSKLNPLPPTAKIVSVDTFLHLLRTKKVYSFLTNKNPVGSGV